MLYYRRKILLALLELFDGQLTAKSLQKYLFLFTRKQGNYLSLLNMYDRQALTEVKEIFGEYSQNDLIRFTYQKYPYYAINSSIVHQLLTPGEQEIVKKQKRKYKEYQLFSIGYEGLSLETYLN